VKGRLAAEHRELENVLHEAVLIGRGPVLLLRDLPHALQGREAVLAPVATGTLEAIRHNRQALERNLIQRVRERHAYRRCGAARELVPAG
jgi:DNA-binding NtrC family response regulator